MATRPGARDPRYRRATPSASPGWPSRAPVAPRPDPERVRRIHLAEHPGCQWQARAIRCVTRAAEVVWSREGVLRSSCTGHLASWLRTGGRRVEDGPPLAR